MGQRPSRPVPPTEPVASTSSSTSAPGAATSTTSPTPTSAPVPTPKQRLTTTTRPRSKKDKRTSVLGLASAGLGSLRKRKPTISRASSATASTSAPSTSTSTAAPSTSTASGSGSGVRVRENGGQANGNGRSWRRWSKAPRKSVVDVDDEPPAPAVNEEAEAEPVVPARSPSPAPQASGSGSGNVEGSSSSGAREGNGEASGEQAPQMGGPLPPAGTLVVVQGVVHTTDVSASSSSSAPHARPQSPASPPSIPPAETGNGQDAGSEEAGRGGERMPTLSPTSIDVLGTLLSVATAATAASLVTGSSAPLFSSGLEPASSSSSSSATPTSGAGSSSTPATSAEGSPHVPSRPPLSPEHERMRSAWGSIRDRFGLGRPSSPSSSSPSTPRPQSRPQSPIPNGEGLGAGREGDDDARTQLLAEMARAFHLGMGLDEPAGASPRAPPAHPPSSPSTTSPSSPQSSPPTVNSEDPAEGSFERFLLDLQSDLRRTLGGPQAVESGAGGSGGAGGVRTATPPPARHIPGPSAESEDEVNSRRADQRASGSRPSTSGQDRLPEEREEEVDGDVLDFVGEGTGMGRRERERADTPHPGARAVAVPDIASSDGHPEPTLATPHPDGAHHNHEHHEHQASTSSDDAHVPSDDDEGIHFADDGPIRPHVDLGRAHDQPRSHTPVSRSGTPRLDHAHLHPHDPSHLHPHPHPHLHTHAHDHPHGASPLGLGMGAGGGAGTGEARGINWWRMYRFPPMRVPATTTTTAGGVPATPSSASGGVPDTTGVAGVRAEDGERVGAAEMGFDSSPTPAQDEDGDEPPPLVDPEADDSSTPRPRDRAPTPYPSSSSQPLHSASPSSSTENDSTDIETEEGTSIVVPVIVVGLQSVHGHRPPPSPSSPTGASAAARASSPTSNYNPNRASSPLPGSAASRRGSSIWPTAPAPGEEGWRARAADAFRGLRRRGGEASGSSSEGAGGERTEESAGRAFVESVAGPGPGEQHANGSTTFFIYVIGGYYPPTHPLVTGAPNAALDSFEALWELADLLGPAKPPTATREDIARAGLRVIKPKEMRVLSAEGRVVEACVERCLICLEDYADADDLRLLGCRHIFHKSCVDTWLETGRNNCPACRAQGVQRAADESVAA